LYVAINNWLHRIDKTRLFIESAIDSQAIDECKKPKFAKQGAGWLVIEKGEADRGSFLFFLKRAALRPCRGHHF
jgi:hypothetical protein